MRTARPRHRPRTSRSFATGELEVLGRLSARRTTPSSPGSSARSRTATPAAVRGQPARGPRAGPLAVWKPTVGERPLFDFPIGTLTRREVAAYLVSEALGWGIVPPTRAPRRPVRRGHAPAAGSTPIRTADVIAMVIEPTTRGCVGRAVRRDRQQHGSQGRPPAAGARRPPPRGRPRRHVLGRAQAPHGPLGVGGRAVRRGRGAAALVTRARRRSASGAGPGPLARRARPTARPGPRDRGHPRARRALLADRRLPRPESRTGPRSPGRRI